MSQGRWTEVDQYIEGLFIPTDPAFQAALSDSANAGLPPIHVAPPQGKFLAILARSIGAKRILEIGTLGGYSTLWFASALPAGGKVITLEASPKHAQVATANIARGGKSGLVDLRLGPALDTLPVLAQEGAGPFDMVFIDADKENCAAYFDWALRLTRPGSLIITDNVVRRGAVIEPDNPDTMVQGVRHFNSIAAAEPRVMATVIQMVGSKGHDGMCVALVL
jgi:predicted O-methyltransferase YrrM